MFYERPDKKKKKREEPPAPESREDDITEPPQKEKRRSVFKYLTETPPRPPESEKKRGRGGFFKVCLWLLSLAALFAFALYILPPGAFGSHDKDMFSANHSLPNGYTHILLIGADVDANSTSRSDTMIIASVGDGNLKLTSIMRDTGVVIPGREGTHRLNAAYAYGGAELLVKTINENFELNITRYARVDYSSFSEIIDLLGGVEVDVTYDEMNEINRNVMSNLNSLYKNGKYTYEAARALYMKEELKIFGDNTRLSGLQAVGYSRIRKLDSDYMRTQRQREVLSAAAANLKGLIKKPVSLVKAATGAMRLVNTNMGTLEILSLGEKVLLSSTPQAFRLPVSGTYTDDGGMFKSVDYTRNKEAFIKFIYDN